MSFFHLLLLLSVIAIWGFNFVAVKTGLDGIPPIFLCFARFLFCLPALFFIARPRVPFRNIAAYSFVMFVLQFSLLFIAMRSGITAGLASILLQFQAFFAMAFAVFFMGETYHLKQLVGAIVALFGILIIAMHIGGDITLLGLILVLSAAVMWAAGSVMAKKMKSNGISLVVWSSLFACPPLLIFSFLLEGSEAIRVCIQNLSLIHLGAVSYIAYFSTLFGFGIWNWLLQYYPLSKLSSFTLLIPIFGMLGSAMFLGEALPWWKIAAAGLIVGGVGINVLAAQHSKSLGKTRDC